MINFNTMAELIRMAEEKSLPVHDIVLAREMHTSQRSRDVLWQEMQRNWQVMQESVQRGIANEEHSVSGLTGASKVVAGVGHTPSRCAPTAATSTPGSAGWPSAG